MTNHSEEQTKNLYERVGGWDVLVRVVDGVYNFMKSDREMGPIFERFAKSAATFQKLKDKTVEYLAGKWGGPVYEGPELYIAHSTMHIEVQLFDSMLKIFKELFEQEGLPADVVAEAMATIVEFRDPICDPDGKLAEEFEARMEKLSAEREERIAYYKANNIKYSRLTGLAIDPAERDINKLKVVAKAKAKAKSQEALAKANAEEVRARREAEAEAKAKADAAEALAKAQLREAEEAERKKLEEWLQAAAIAREARSAETQRHAAKAQALQKSELRVEEIMETPNFWSKTFLQACRGCRQPLESDLDGDVPIRQD
eukprot:TRINITY_DN35937_c0_g1_i1.p1 TRINITY_DN35937_c0_g1~~TRINITY_DN35937_c0_g1_i1.p1  ORF type:complete len:315 (+),score=94.99 TRINITY_DN35937_c0_g1_i1:156-1100(+)